jgi:uncharacterized protein YbaR (Trm112 family)
MNNGSSAFKPRPIHGRLDQRLLEVLVCPASKASLTYNELTNELYSANARLAYPVRDGIPIMIIEEARPLTE